MIAGGGTGGHVVPSLQIARALVSRGHAPEDVELFGSRRGQEATVWPPLEFPFTLLPGRGIRRSLKPRALWDNAGAVLGLGWAVLRAIGSFVGRRPGVVVVVGGYASLAAGVAAVVVRAPLVLVHIDAVPGAVNGLLTRFAAANTVSFPGMGLPHSTLTGTPVRPDFNALDRSEAGRRQAKVALGVPEDNLLVVATGGSLGARRINTAIAELAARWQPSVPVTIYQITGRRDYAQFSAGGSVRASAWTIESLSSRTGCRSSTKPPMCLSAGPGPTRWPNCRSRACRRYWCRSPARPATIRPSMPGRWRPLEPPW